MSGERSGEQGGACAIAVRMRMRFKRGTPAILRRSTREVFKRKAHTGRVAPGVNRSHNAVQMIFVEMKMPLPGIDGLRRKMLRHAFADIGIAVVNDDAGFFPSEAFLAERQCGFLLLKVPVDALCGCRVVPLRAGLYGPRISRPYIALRSETRKHQYAAGIAALRLGMRSQPGVPSVLGGCAGRVFEKKTHGMGVTPSRHCADDIAEIVGIELETTLLAVEMREFRPSPVLYNVKGPVVGYDRRIRPIEAFVTEDQRQLAAGGIGARNTLCRFIVDGIGKIP